MLEKAKKWAVIVESENCIPFVALCKTEHEAVKVCKEHIEWFNAGARRNGPFRVRIFKYAGAIRQMTIFDVDKESGEKEELPF